ncbi:MAG: family 43 glycosylhydrolase [Tepidisphaeraceae bacterium]
MKPSTIPLVTLLLSGLTSFTLAEGPAKPAHGPVPATTFPADAPPPILTDKFTADPDARVFGDTYYIYPTVDKEFWKTTEFNVWSSKDLIHWTDRGVILNIAGGDVSWATGSAWAPGVTTRDGKYYMYFCANQRIGVAVADRPTGPFKDAIGHPLVEAGNPPQLKGQQIDPCPFIDDTSTHDAYLYWGNSHLYVRKLAPDMISFAGELKEITPKINNGRFNEGIFVIKRKGTYYFMWSENDARSPDYRVAYGTSKSPWGPISVPEHRIILSKSGSVVGTGHHSVINVPGTDRWYIVYHRHAIPGGNGYIRETCLAPLHFNDDGSVQPVDVNHPAFPAGSEGESIPAAAPHP